METKLKWDTVYNADSVEWCPLAEYADVLVCGTYQLDKTEQVPEQTKKQKRLGRIYLFVIKHNTTSITALQTIETCGILDQKWCTHEVAGHPLLGAVTAEGSLQIYQLLSNGKDLNLKLLVEESIQEENVLALSLDWSTNKYATEAPKLAVSDSAGNVRLFLLCGDKLTELGCWKAHGFEAWITAFNYWTPDIFYSGGDDCVFKSFDCRTAETATITNRSHEAGVTSLRSSTDIEHQLISGSYDEKIRLWDTRNLKRPSTEINIKGGVWRLKYNPRNSDIVLAACMYGGFRVLKLSDQMFSVITEYMEHESIAYGADWKHQIDDKTDVVATCSFYDSKMHISEMTI